MKTFAFLLFLAGVAIARADDDSLLKNGDFADGVADWYGDCHSIDNGSSDFSDAAPATPSGITVTLRSDDWSKVIQDFDGKAGDYLLTISYSTSPDLAFSTKPEDYKDIPGKVEFSRLKPFSSTPGHWIVIVNDLGALRYRYWQITPPPTSTGIQTLTMRVPLKSDEAEKKGFYLLFPPGTGVVTLHTITLMSHTAEPPATQ